MSSLSLPGIAPFVAALAASSPAIRSVWSIGQNADRRADRVAGPPVWDFLVFADGQTLVRLRTVTALHRQDVRLRVVVDGDRFERAWGDGAIGGTLRRWEWIETTHGEAFYYEARWSLPWVSAAVERVRRQAACVWRSPNTASAGTERPRFPRR